MRKELTPAQKNRDFYKGERKWATPEEKKWACSRCDYRLACYHDCGAWHISWIPTEEQFKRHNDGIRDSINRHLISMGREPMNQ